MYKLHLQYLKCTLTGGPGSPVGPGGPSCPGLPVAPVGPECPGTPWLPLAPFNNKKKLQMKGYKCLMTLGIYKYKTEIFVFLFDKKHKVTNKQMQLFISSYCCTDQTVQNTVHCDCLTVVFSEQKTVIKS